MRRSSQLSITSGPAPSNRVVVCRMPDSRQASAHASTSRCSSMALLVSSNNARGLSAGSFASTTAKSPNTAASGSINRQIGQQTKPQQHTPAQERQAQSDQPELQGLTPQRVAPFPEGNSQAHCQARHQPQQPAPCPRRNWPNGCRRHPVQPYRHAQPAVASGSEVNRAQPQAQRWPWKATGTP